MAVVRSFEGPALFEAFGEEEKRDGDEQNADGNRGAERPVIGGAEEALNDIGDHGAGRAADEQRREKIAERENESEGGAGEQAGNGERKNHAEKRLRGAGAEILRGFDERARDVFERRVDGKKNERRVNVRQHEDDGEWAVEKEADRVVREVQILQKAVEHAVAAENRFPSVTANQIADPERNDDELIEEFFARAGVERQKIGERIAEEERAKRNGGGDAHRAKKYFDVNGFVNERAVIAQVPVMDDEAVANGPEAVSEHQRVGEQQEQADPKERR